MFVTDREGLRVIQGYGVFRAFEDKWYTHTYSHVLSLFFSLSLSHARTHTLSLSLSPLSLSLSLSHTHTHRAAVNSGEYGVSRAILEAGYSLTSLDSAFAHTDLSLAQNW